jgi:hypothetical protein
MQKVVSKEDQYWLDVTKDLFSPQGDGLKVGLTNRLHNGQIEALAPLYEGDITTLMLPCGRKFGKTDAACFVLWHQALFVPGSACYFIAPEGSHGRELLWRNKRLQEFMGRKVTAKYIKKTSQQDMTIYLKNGSFIRIMGSENWAAGNGLTPHVAVYDEFKAFHPQWHTEFNPNRGAKAAKLVIIGTQPKMGDRNIDQYNSILEYCKKDKNSSVVVKTTWDNPINHLPEQKQMIEQDIARLRANGDEDIVQREYYSKIVAGGSSSVFPMLKEEHVMEHSKVMEEIKRDLKKLEWYAVADPGTTTCFAVLLAAVNPYTKKMYLLDEIYEKDQKATSTRILYPRLQMKMIKLNRFIEADDWYKVYDEAGAWFANEVLVGFNATFFKTDKRHGDKEEGLSIIKDQLVHNSVIISSQCKHLFSEMQRYAKDSKGKIPKKNDHLIDCYRYLIDAANYDFNSVMEFVKRIDPLQKGRYRNRDEDNEMDLDDDWTDNFGDDIDWEM